MATGTPRHSWTDSVTAITAAKLNETEQDVADALATANAAVDVTDATGTRDATTFLRGDKVWAAPATGSSYTDEQVRDVMGAALVAGSNVTITPNDGANTITVAASTGAASVGANIRDYGAVGDGTTDDTAAFAAARAASNHVIVPAGNYLYTGNGLSADGLVLEGEGSQSSIVTLGAGKSLVVASNSPRTMHVSGIRFLNGFGAIRLTYTGISVQGPLTVENCQFWYYTGTAISSLSVDQPYWRIHSNEFYALDSTSSTMGVALLGDNAGSTIDANLFENNRVHLKLQSTAASTGASAVYVAHNDFIRWESSTTARTDIWIVPFDHVRTSGFMCHDNKFGPENLGVNDYRVLYADEAAGSDSAVRLYSTTTSTNRISGQIYRGNVQGTPGTARIPFITSYVPDTLAQVVRDHTLDGSTPTYILNMAATGGSAVTAQATSIIGPVFSSELGISGVSGVQACNVSGYATTIDPTGQFGQTNAPMPAVGGSRLTGFVDLTSSRLISAYSLAGSTTMSATTDGIGGTDSATVTSSSGSLYTTITGLIANRPVWIELDAKLAGASQVGYFVVSMAVSGTDRWKRQVPLTSVWKPWRFLFTPADTSVNQITFYPPTTPGSWGLGRVRVYHAGEPVAMDLLKRIEALEAP